MEVVVHVEIVLHQDELAGLEPGIESVPGRGEGYVGEPEELGFANELPDCVGKLEPEEEVLECRDFLQEIWSQEAHGDGAELVSVEVDVTEVAIMDTK